MVYSQYIWCFGYELKRFIIQVEVIKLLTEILSYEKAEHFWAGEALKALRN